MTPGRRDDDDDDDDLLDLDDLSTDDGDPPLDLDEDEPLGTDLGDWSATPDVEVDLGEVDDGDPHLVDLDPVDADEDDDLDLDLSDDDDDGSPSLVVVAWSGVATLPALGIDVPCVCDPAAARSELTLPEPPDTPRLELELRFEELTVTALLDIVAGPAARLRLGRDVLGGRALVRP